MAGEFQNTAMYSTSGVSHASWLSSSAIHCSRYPSTISACFLLTNPERNTHNLLHYARPKPRPSRTRDGDASRKPNWYRSMLKESIIMVYSPWSWEEKLCVNQACQKERSSPDSVVLRFLFLRGCRPRRTGSIMHGKACTKFFFNSKRHVDVLASFWWWPFKDRLRKRFVYLQVRCWYPEDCGLNGGHRRWL